jgi:Rrf2 family protein
MFKINRKIEYALIALKYMDHKGGTQLVTAKEICDTYHTPFDPTSRVLQLMAQDGILKAEHGAYGGYQIIKDLSQVRLSDLFAIITGPMQIAGCFHEHHSLCDMTATCNVISPMLNLNEKMGKLFAATTIKELIASRHSLAERQIKAKPIEKVAVS